MPRRLRFRCPTDISARDSPPDAHHGQSVTLRRSAFAAGGLIRQRSWRIPWRGAVRGLGSGQVRHPRTVTALGLPDRPPSRSEKVGFLGNGLGDRMGHHFDFDGKC